MANTVNPTDSSTRNRSVESVQKTRSWAGLLVVVLGDFAIAIAAIWGVIRTDGTQSVAILASAFTAVSTMTTAYFGLRAMSNSAESTRR